MIAKTAIDIIEFEIELSPFIWNALEAPIAK